MRILVAALYVRGIVSEGGSSFYMKCIIDNLRELGHQVHVTDCPSMIPLRSYDLIVCSHNEILRQLSRFKVPKVCISQGIIKQEELHAGADIYYSVSEEAQEHNRALGIESSVIGQPVNLQSIVPVNDSLKNILIIRNHGTLTGDDPFACLTNKYTVRNSDPTTPIEDQMKWADVCVTLGRGAVSAMSLGRPVLVADNRYYQGKVGDGYTNRNTLHEIAKHNFSGRRYRYPVTEEWLLSELEKYDSSDSKMVYDYVCENHDMKKAIIRILSDVSNLTGKGIE